jgi:hypothetical protein
LVALKALLFAQRVLHQDHTQCCAFKQLKTTFKQNRTGLIQSERYFLKNKEGMSKLLKLFPLLLF